MASAGVEYLLGRAGLVEQRVRSLVTQSRHDDPAPDDPFRGLYLSDEAADRLLVSSPEHATFDDESRRSDLERRADARESAGEQIALRRLQRDAGLTDVDTELLVVAMLPDLDSRFERLYGYLNDDVSRRRATVGLAFNLAGVPAAEAANRRRLSRLSPLVDRLLLLVEDNERPFLTRGLRVPDQVTSHLLGDQRTDPLLADVAISPVPHACEVAQHLAAVIARGSRLIYLRDQTARTGMAVASSALDMLGRAVLGLDLTRLAHAGELDELVAIISREVLLRGAGIVAGPVEALASTSERTLRRLASLPASVLLVGTGTWDPRWAPDVPLLADAPVLTPSERVGLWEQELRSIGVELDPADVTGHFVLGPEQTKRAVKGAQAAAWLDGQPVSAEHLRAGARAQNAAGLEELARRIEPRVTWADLVLPASITAQLHDVAARARHRDLVLTEWRMRPGGGRGTGLTAMFAGDSGTGKTMSAEVIACELGLDLYAVNLATVVDKYVGETEKNLERIFHEASGVNAVLLFDEADAIFGKRSEVRDAHDRYANIESAYLLQRMETFDGLAILSTNLRANIDEAFTRRLDAIIDFPRPDQDLRRELWKRCLAPPLPTTDDIDLEFCSRSFELSGGNIRSVAITAAYLSASAGTRVGMGHIMAAMHQEYRKLGRLVVEHEFGPYLSRAT